jgi:hypothetical protein
MLVKQFLAKARQGSTVMLIGYLTLTMLVGCGTVRVEVEDPITPVRFPAPVMDQIVLLVAVPPDQFMANGQEGFAPLNNPDKFQERLGNSLQHTLTTSGFAKGVLTGPSNRSWTMSVTGKWNSKWSWSEYTWEIVKITFTVILLFIPAFFISESFTVRTEADVILTDPSGLERGRYNVQSRLEVDIAVRNASKELFDGMFTMSSDDLANRMVLELKRHPHWFEAAR